MKRDPERWKNALLRVEQPIEQNQGRKNGHVFTEEKQSDE
jgi:hypothetical protein